MSENSYRWKRFWCPRESGFNLGDNGFLYDPDSKYGEIYNPDVLSSRDLCSKPGLALLGEPGIGKSYEIRAFGKIALKATEKSNDEVLFVDLKAFRGEDRLYAAIFGDEKFKRWVGGTHRLHLFLDSLDECLLRIQTVTGLLSEELSKYQLKRLILRVACRTAEWPNSFEDSLRGLYGKEELAVYELVPLTRKDVEAALTCEGVDVEGFLKQVKERNAAPLANKPITLKMLIEIFQREGSFPSRQAGLYEKGCLLMCEETNEYRRDTGLSGTYTADVLLIAASRIAAVAIFGNRYAVWTDIDRGDIPPEDVTINQLSGGGETLNGKSVEITDDLIKGAIRTGLFTSRGAHRMGWAHQTYAEFLAARYLTQSGMKENQIMSLLVHPDDPKQKLVPQLYEAAAWAAGMHEKVFDNIMEREPEVLLRSDVASCDPEDKRRLVKRLLSLFEKEKLLDMDKYRYYSKLRHPSLAEQLMPYIYNKSKGFLVRRVAIDIAEACEVEQVLPELVSVALDQDDDLSARANAAHAVEQIGDSQTKAKLKPLAFGQGGTDPDDRLKGWALKAIWPEYMTAEELFRALTHPQNERHIGSYEMFLHELPQVLEETLNPEGLKFALEWVAKTGPGIYHFKEIQEWIMMAGWEHLLDLPALAEPFAKAAMGRLLQHHPIASGNKERRFGETIRNDDDKRRLVLGAVLGLPDVSEERLAAIAFSQTPLVINADVPWLVQQYENGNPEERKKLAKLIGLVFGWTDCKYLEDVLEAKQKFTDIAREVQWLNPVEIDSPEGRKLKAQYLKHQRLEKRLAEQRSRPLLTPPPKERVLALLDKFEDGEVNAWWWLNREMTLEPNSEYYGNELQCKLTELPVWKDADEEMRSRIINAARQYLLHPPDMDKSWLGTNTINCPYMAGYRALVLLMDKDPVFVSQLPESAWKMWAPIIVAYPLNIGEGKEPHISLMKIAYQVAPEEIIESLLTIIDKENAQHDNIFIIRRIEHCLDDRLDNALLKKTCSADMKSSCMGDLLDLLIEHNYEPAIKYAKSEITIPFPKEEAQREHVLTVAESLFANRPNIGWEIIWPAIQDDIKFGKEVFERSVRLYRHDKIGLFTQQLNEEQIADMYLWLVKQYPYEEDPKHEGAHAVGVRESIAHFRDGLLEQLKIRGTPKSSQQIRRIAKALRHLTWMKWVIIEAEKNTRRRTWNPPTSEKIIKIAHTSGRSPKSLIIGVVKTLYQWTAESFYDWISKKQYPI